MSGRAGATERHPSSLLALDVGNTSVAAARFDAPAASSPPRFTARHARATGAADADATELRRWVAIVREQSPDRVVIGSVHRFGALLAAALRGERGLRDSLRHFDRGDEFPLRADVEEPAKVGVDRLAGALAAFTLARGAARVVSAGTAITVDWIDAGPLFRGGAIAAGRRLQARALHEHTERLPAVEPAPDEPPHALPGRSTREAIEAAIDVGVPGQVAALVAGLRRAARAELPVYASGGDAAWLVARLGAGVHHESYLVARGLALAAEGGA